MAVASSESHIIVPIEKDWTNFRLQYDGKHIMLLGSDGKTKDWFTGQLEEVVLCSVEQHWDDLATWEVLSRASDEYGKLFLILQRCRTVRND
jgi:hypothetical protein